MLNYRRVWELRLNRVRGDHTSAKHRKRVSKKSFEARRHWSLNINITVNSAVLSIQPGEGSNHRVLFDCTGAGESFLPCHDSYLPAKTAAEVG